MRLGGVVFGRSPVQGSRKASDVSPAFRLPWDVVVASHTLAVACFVACEATVGASVGRFAPSLYQYGQVVPSCMHMRTCWFAATDGTMSPCR